MVLIDQLTENIEFIPTSFILDGTIEQYNYDNIDPKVTIDITLRSGEKYTYNVERLVKYIKNKQNKPSVKLNYEWINDGIRCICNTYISVRYNKTKIIYKLI